MRVCDASTSISAEFGGIRDSCLDIYHLIRIFLKGTTHMTMKFLGRWQMRNMETEETRMRAMLASRDCAADCSLRCIAVLARCPTSPTPTPAAFATDDVLCRIDCPGLLLLK